MNQLVMSLAWCWTQALVVALLAIVFSALAMRRSPASGAAIAWAGILATLVLTLLAPVPVPRWGRQLAVVETSMAPTAGSPRAADRATSRLMPHAGETDESPTGVTMNLALLRNIATSVERSQTAVANYSGAGRMLLGFLALGVLLGLARTAYGLWGIANLCKGSRMIFDDRLAAAVRELASAIGLRSLPQVCESRDLVSAAVVGWWRPVVILPEGWREWSERELRAVIAHELAHICRRDLVLRLVAALTVAIQCGQPLVYWLRRQLMLSQEMAADELAASAVGSRTEYLKSLSRLALRQDSRLNDGPVSMLLPVFSGFLLRRIEMLRAKDGSTRRAMRLPMQWTAIAFLIAAAAGTTAIRGLAQPPETQADGSVRVARATDSKPKPAAVAADAHAAAAVLFQRRPFDPSTVAGKDGGFLVRLGELLKRTGFTEQAGKLDASFAAFWKDAFSDAEAPAWSLQDIEYIAGDLFFKVRPAPKPTKEHPNEVGFGALFVIVRWNKPLNGQFEWLLRTPGATEKSHEGTTYVELPIMPALGPTKICVCRLDDHSIFAAQNEKWFLSRLTALHAPAEAKDWQKAWKDVDGGLMALVSTDANIERPLGEAGDAEAELLIHDLFSQTRGYAIGVDWQEGADGVSVVKGQFRFDTAEDANRFKNAIRTWTDKAADLVKAEDAKVDEENTETNRQANKQIKLMLEALQQAKVETRQSDDGWVVDLQLAGPLDYRPLWMQ